MDLTAGSEPAQEPPDECPLCEGRGWVRSEASIGNPNFGKANPCLCQTAVSQGNRLALLQRHSNLGSLSRLTFETLSSVGRSSDHEAQRRFQEATQAATEYAQEPQGWLVLAGPVGAGKTHLLAAIANRCLAHGNPTMYISVPDLLDHLRAAFAPTSDVPYDQLFEQVRNSQILILDDLGAQAATPWAQEKLYQLINHRFNLQLPTVIAVSGPLVHLDEQLQIRLKDPHLVFTIDLAPSASPVHWRLDRIKHELMERMTFESFDTRGHRADASGQESLEQALRSAKEFSVNPTGWIIFTGVPGSGKTHLAVAIVNARLQLGHPAMFAFVPDLLDYLRFTFRPESPMTYSQIFEEVRSVPLLVLDDLGAQSSTAWAAEKLYQILVHRHEMQLPTVITVRGYIEDIPEESVRSRLKDVSLVDLVPIGAPDYRASGARSRRGGQRTRTVSSATHSRSRGNSGY